MKDEIIGQIRRLAAENDGKAPGQIAFARATGIREHQWLGKLWARWSDAVSEAGLSPNIRTMRLDSERVLAQIVAACHAYGKVPTKAEFNLYRTNNPDFPSVKAVSRHFGSRDQLIDALSSLSQKDEALAKLLPYAEITMTPPPNAEREAVKDGHVYLLKSGEFYKVGRSDNLERRVKEVRVAMPDALTLLHSIRTDDPAGIEAYWHRRFADRRANGEWFKLTRADLAAFRRRTYQ